jgi:molybdopterin-containing oxidoreductase family iron-sulfur binding subunit
MTTHQKPLYWRSLAELTDDAPLPAEAQAYAEQRIPDHEELFGNPLNRRRFMQISGATVALAGAAGMAGCRYEEDHIVPEARRPPDYVPGMPKRYASAMELGGVGYGLLVTAYDGRPIKVDGNPEHPHTGQGSTPWMQSSILDVYDPDRSGTVQRQGGGKQLPGTWADVEEMAAKVVAELGASGGKGFHVLSEATSSPTVMALKAELLRKHPQARWHEWEPLSHDAEREGLRVAFGRPMRAHLQLTKAKVIAALDVDLFGDHPDGLRLSREFAAGRNPESQDGMNRLYAVEPVWTSTGVASDHRLPLRSELVKPFLVALEIALGGPGGAGESKALGEAKNAKFVEVLAKDLSQNKGAAAVAVGPRQDPEVHALAARVNALLGGDVVVYTDDPDPARPAHWADLQDLVGAMSADSVRTLLIIGGNPVFNAPASLDFGAALAKVKTSIHLSTYADETSARCNWHLPRAHFLESWGDTRTHDGTLTLAQPIIEPLLGGRSAIDVLKHFVGRPDVSAQALVRETFDALTAPPTGLDLGVTTGEAPGTPRGPRPDNDGAWRRALHDGFVAGSAPTAGSIGAPSNVALKPLTTTQAEGTRLANGKLELCFMPSSVYDGRFANNAWLQETPDFLTKVTWDNVALISPKTAADLGVKNQELIEIEIGGVKQQVAAYVMPGQASFSIGLGVGQGRTRAGRVGGLDGVSDPVGFDTYKLRTGGPLAVAGVAKVRGTGTTYRLSMTVDHHVPGATGTTMDEIGKKAITERAPELIKEATLEEYRHNPGFVTEGAHTQDAADLTRPTSADASRKSLFEEHKYTDTPHRWGMTTDLTKCTGCNACMLACQSENNVPVVGKEQVFRNREMHWLRIDRYFRGDAEDPQISHQPILCQQCENAPCEQVCPVGATLHSDEGLNEMTYNRCVGTRYCLNNCPYRVRRFNFLRWDWYKQIDDPRNQIRKLLFNPEVTVRSRGVMEKCTFCVQRIQATKIVAKNERRPIADGEITTACAQACPTGAITFGDLQDEQSRVAQQQKLPRAYALLAELNTRPRNAFLGRIRNPHPDLV